jgi:hypothetical protein
MKMKSMETRFVERREEQRQAVERATLLAADLVGYFKLDKPSVECEVQHEDNVVRIDAGSRRLVIVVSHADCTIDDQCLSDDATLDQIHDFAFRPDQEQFGVLPEQGVDRSL